MQASTSRVAVVKSRLPIAPLRWIKYRASALLWTSVVRSDTTPLRIPQLKEYKAKLTVTGAVINSTLLSDPTARSSARTSRSFSRRLNDRLCSDLHQPFQVFVDLDS